MHIAALPPNTVRAIGSTQALTDAASVVKELIDNALDARASAIFVEISTNTLDVIQVKDNGHGIGPDDRDMVCRRYCTSKIRELDDLEIIGGTSLGFRGEALASAAEMSGSVVVTTRVEGEAVAVTSKFGRQGEIESQERASHPVGTSIRVVEFLKNLPVRRQTALKSTAATLSKIKRTLKAYAIARPATRFSLKVLKAKNDKDNWVYAPKAGACASDAAIKVVGKEVVGQYFSVIGNGGHYISIDTRPVSHVRGVLKQMIGLYKSYLRSTCPSDNRAKLAEPFISMNIVCPTGSYDVNVEPAKDDVLFLDSDGFLATLERFFHSTYGELQPKDDSRKTSKQAVSRPQGFEILLAKKSPVTKNSVRPAQLENDENINQDQRNPACGPQDLSLNPDTAVVSNVLSSIGALSDQANFRRETTQEKAERSKAAHSSEIRLGNGALSENVRHDLNQKEMWQRNMYSDDYDQDDDLYNLSDSEQRPQASEDADKDEVLRDNNASNPWTIAKLNAPVQIRPSDIGASGRLRSNGQLLTPRRQRGDISSPSIAVLGDTSGDAISAVPSLPTPRRSQLISSPVTDLDSPSSYAFPYPMKAWGRGDRITTSRTRKPAQQERYSAGALDTWVQSSLNHLPTDLERLESPENDSSVEYTMPNRNSTRDFVSARILPIGTPLDAIPEVSQKPNRRPAPRKLQQNINKPFISPVNDPDRVWFETGQSRRNKPAPPAAAQSVREAIAATAPIHDGSDDEIPIIERNTAPRLSPKPMHPDLAVTMDYEMRKQAAMQKQKDFLRQQALDARQQKQSSTDDPGNVLPPANSPHKNRYNAAVASLASSNPTATTGMTSALEDSDPRAYLLRVQQRDEADRQGGANGVSRKLKRRKTTMLPLETTPAEATVQDLVLMIETTENTIGTSVQILKALDEYISAGRVGEGFASLGVEDVRAWEGRVRGLVDEHYQSEVGDKVSIELDLWSAVQSLMGMDVAVDS
ncbi:MAG: hypothetical protein LQ347_001610 [Umbilicaria vellea]|nr:MAG: hypothetical protein LQ347_001610 [Umbilicaria vellea]